ncbi:MAG: proton-conducting transporter membrane subunit [Desulfobacteraceae bacterium]|nr:proton-conducting transporter membrane subunit [Desulfobacteraceae bacterium]
MLIIALILIPSLAGISAFFIRNDPARRMLLAATAVIHLFLSFQAVSQIPLSPANCCWLALDPLGGLFLMITSLLFAVVSIYSVGYLGREGIGEKKDFVSSYFFVNAPEAVFTGCLLLFLATMTMVTTSQHMGLLWVAVEATTLTSAPLIYFHRHHRSLEAAWKYLLICSVGIAIALLGTFFLAVAASNQDIPLTVNGLMTHASNLEPTWLKAAFIFFIVGYGTKMGLAPLNTWLPDAHSESPSLVSALMSGALLNCAFLGILRMFQVASSAGLAPFGQGILLILGLASMALAAIFILGQTDYKRMLAYSSVEHMGILSFGVGLGGAGAFGAMLHAVNHSLTKGMLFMVAGNALTAFKTKSTLEVKGMLRLIPVSGALWIAGILAITGSPPFGPFISEFTILKAALDQGEWLAAVLYLSFLAVIFVAMATIGIRMAFGTPENGVAMAKKEPVLSIAPCIALGALVLFLGLYVPPSLDVIIHEAARSLGFL